MLQDRGFRRALAEKIGARQPQQGSERCVIQHVNTEYAVVQFFRQGGGMFGAEQIIAHHNDRCSNMEMFVVCQHVDTHWTGIDGQRQKCPHA